VTAVPNPPHPARHLLRGRDYVDSNYADPELSVDDMARAAGLSKAHFTREFGNSFGESPRAYLLTRRLERAAHLLRHTDHMVLDICLSVGLTSVGSFTSSFSRTYGESPTTYRASFPAAKSLARPPACYARMYGRPPRAPNTARLEKTAGEPGNTVAPVE
jgi:AraC-like DNA-binding protein